MAADRQASSVGFQCQGGAPRGKKVGGGMRRRDRDGGGPLLRDSLLGMTCLTTRPGRTAGRGTASHAGATTGRRWEAAVARRRDGSGQGEPEDYSRFIRLSRRLARQIVRSGAIQPQSDSNLSQS